MNYWFTTHWPQRVDEPQGQAHFGVWIPDGMLDVVDGMKPGDHVFIYEASGGRTAIRRNADGSVREAPCRKGRSGVVLLAEITGKPSEHANSAIEEYTEGSPRWWRYCAPTVPINSTGFIPKARVLQLFGFSPRYTMRGFGGGSGIKRLHKDTFDAFHIEFFTSTKNANI